MILVDITCEIHVKHSVMKSENNTLRVHNMTNSGLYIACYRKRDSHVLMVMIVILQAPREFMSWT